MKKKKSPPPSRLRRTSHRPTPPPASLAGKHRLPATTQHRLPPRHRPAQPPPPNSRTHSSTPSSPAAAGRSRTSGKRGDSPGATDLRGGCVHRRQRTLSRAAAFRIEGSRPSSPTPAEGYYHRFALPSLPLSSPTSLIASR
jgi:hypothetical protein